MGEKSKERGTGSPEVIFHYQSVTLHVFAMAHMKSCLVHVYLAFTWHLPVCGPLLFSLIQKPGWSRLTGSL